MLKDPLAYIRKMTLNISDRIMLVLKKIDKKSESQFTSFVDGDSNPPHKPLYALFRLASFAVVIVFMINLFSIGTSSFGEWGDFFGGVLNPALTFLMFMGVLFTIVL